MFYCNQCAKENNFPESFSKSRGKCELCEEGGVVCNDVPSNELPDPNKKEE